MSVVTNDDSKINELFVRLNRSKPLTGAEVRNAMAGAVPGLIRRIAEHEFFTTRIRFGTNRGEDRNAAAKLLLLEFRGKLVDTKKVHLDRLVEEGIAAEAGSAEFERAAERVERILDRMVEIFIDRDSLLSSQGPVVLYYWLVRDNKKEFDGMVRDFIVSFERMREQNRVLSRDPKAEPELIDAELLRFDTMNRSTNDQASLEGRFAILDERFQEF
jgi:hypothetical protein